MRVFIGLHEIAGYYSRLIEGLEEEGIKTTFLTHSPHPFGYKAENSNNWLQKWFHFSMQNPRKRKIRELSKLLLVIYLALTHKVFIFSYLSSFNLFQPYGELKLLKLLGRRIIYVMHGSDSRPNFLERHGLSTMDKNIIPRQVLLSNCNESVQKIKTIEKYADYIIAHPLSAQWHRKPFINWSSIGVPIPNHISGEKTDDLIRKVPIILHSPSDPQGKGTPQIRKAIESLRNKGFCFEYVELIGKPHAEIIEALKQCSFVIDQLFSDIPMATFAAEAAAQGKAAIVGSYGWRELHQNSGVTKENFPPVIECHPDHLETVLEKALNSPNWVKTVGLSAKLFIENNWAPGKVAAKYKLLFDKKAPNEWFFYPENIQYFMGCVVRHVEIRVMVRNLINLASPDSLNLNDKPELKSALIKMATDPQSPEMEILMNRILSLETLIEQQSNQDAQQIITLENKLENFRGMIARRDSRIEKIEKKLKAKKK